MVAHIVELAVGGVGTVAGVVGVLCTTALDLHMQLVGHIGQVLRVLVVVVLVLASVQLG
jgi:hypothetical protein